MRQNIEMLIKKLDDEETNLSILNKIKELPQVPEKLALALIKAGINVRDPSANGYFLEPIIQHFPLINIRNAILSHFFNGNFSQQAGALKLLYHIQKDTLHFDEKLEQVIEIPKLALENKQEYEERKDILIPEYQNCKNPVLRFFFKWALPGEEWIRNEQPETINDLWKSIKGSNKYSEMFINIYPEYNQSK